MPEISVAVSPVPVVSTPSPAAASTSSTGVASSEGSAATDNQGAADFAAVLKKQMAPPEQAKQSEQATADAAATVADLAADAPPETPDLTAILPMLANSAAIAETPTDTPAMSVDESAGTAAAIASLRAKATKDDSADDAPLAAPIVVATPTTDSIALTETKGDKASTAPALPSTLPANLAETAERTAASAKEGAPTEDFAALVDGHRNAAAHATAGTSPGKSGNVAAPVTTHVTTPVGAHGWDAEVGDRLVWMAGRNESRAELVLTPPQLGRIEVSLSMSGDHANAVFVSASPAVRDALQDAIPRLREILADAGVTLGQAQVGADSPGYSANQQERGDNSSRGGRTDFPIGSAPAAVGNAGAAIQSGRGLVDVFA